MLDEVRKLEEKIEEIKVIEEETRIDDDSSELAKFIEFSLSMAKRRMSNIENYMTSIMKA